MPGPKTPHKRRVVICLAMSRERAHCRTTACVPHVLHRPHTLRLTFSEDICHCEAIQHIRLTITQRFTSPDEPRYGGCLPFGHVHGPGSNQLLECILRLVEEQRRELADCKPTQTLHFPHRAEPEHTHPLRNPGVHQFMASDPARRSDVSGGAILMNSRIKVMIKML
jgi:hypothetical protein